MITNSKIIRKIEGIRFSIGTIFLVLCCTFLIICSTFLQFNVTHLILPRGFFTGENLILKDYITSYLFIPQIPVAMFVGAFLGRKYGITSIVLYIIIGLFIFPVFALGGGPKYVFEYGFGYILAYIPAVFFAGTILKSGYTVKNMLKATLVGILTVHLIGTLYMLFIASLKHEGWMFMKSWIFAQSGIKIYYDIVFSFATIFIAKYAKIILWFFM